MTDRVGALQEIDAELRVMARRFREVMAERAAQVHPDLHPASAYLLGYLVENGPTRGSTLARRLDVDKAVVSRQIHHLAELGLVDLVADPADGRAQLIVATADAAQRVRAAQADLHQTWRRRSGRWSDADLKSFAAQLRRFNGDLG